MRSTFGLAVVVSLANALTTAQSNAQFTNAQATLPEVGYFSYGLATTWGDFDNDGRLDLLLVGATTNYPNGSIAQVWRNLGNGAFTDFNAGLPGAADCAVACGDFDNDGYLDVAISGNGGGAFTQIWRNQGNGSFTNLVAGLPNTLGGSLAWADFNNDGHLDLLVTGLGNIICQIWRNLGNGKFTNSNAGLPGVYWSSVAVGDFDGDALPDIFVTGYTNIGGQNPSSSISQVWRNLGAGSFTNLNVGLPGVSEGSVACADFDNDGRLDLLLTGYSSTVYIAQIWRNLGSGVFTNMNVSLPGVYEGSVATGDYDNDGFPDILITGLDYSTFAPITQVWRNVGNWTFTNIGLSVPGVTASSVAWADYNSDGRLDFLLAGATNSYAAPTNHDICQIWRNYGAASNTPPTAPGGLSAGVTNIGVRLNWNAATDAETPSAGLTYTVRMGTSPGAFDVVSPLSDPATGRRRVAQPGAVGQRLFAVITNLIRGNTYYWSVQAVDSAFSGGPFAMESSFTVPAIAPTVSTLPSTNLTPQTAVLNASVIPNGASTVAWFRYGPDTNYGTVTTATNVGGGVNPVTVSVVISNLVPGASYHVQPLASNVMGIGLGADSSVEVPIFGLGSNVLPALQFGAAAWGDYDNDGKLDLLISGYTNSPGYPTLAVPTSQVWRNLGDGMFTNINAALPGVGFSSVAWGDFDNDGYLDILLAGRTISGYTAGVWRNLGGGVFTNIQVALPGVAYCSVGWGDYDNDGRLDILLTGYTGSKYLTQVWRNLGSGVFAKINTTMPGIGYGAAAWGDFDGDGFLDILLTGATTNSPYFPVTQIWRNVGNGTFTNMPASLPSLFNSSAAWGDYDNDGWLDVLVAGAPTNSPNAPIAQVWRNGGDSTFTNAVVGLSGLEAGSVAWGDFDNDGRPDALISGFTNSSLTYTASQPLFQLWRNQSNSMFDRTNAASNQLGAPAAWADFDNDGRLDLLGLSSLTFPGFARLLHNSLAATNVPPSAPTNLAATITRSGVLLGWGAASDDHTPFTGLSYNVRVGTSPGASDVVSPLADAVTGWRRVPQMGNAQKRTYSLLTNLPSGVNFYWSVQAVDSALAGGPFAQERSFMIATPPVILQNANLGWQSGVFGFDITGPSGRVAIVQASTNLRDWTDVFSTMLNNSSTHFGDSQSVAIPARFYRVVLP